MNAVPVIDGNPDAHAARLAQSDPFFRDDPVDLTM